MDEESLFPRRLLKLMGGGSENGAFYSMGKQVQEDEFKSMDYIVKADAILNEFKADKANRKWRRRTAKEKRKKMVLKRNAGDRGMGQGGRPYYIRKDHDRMVHPGPKGAAVAGIPQL